MEPSRLTIMAIGGVVGVGISLGLVLAPAISASRPLPAPVTVRVPLFTADVLDLGPTCLYAWDGDLYTWSREDLGIRVEVRCPARVEARRRYEESQTAPVPYEAAP